MNRLDYTSAVATVRVYEKRLLDSARFERMIDAASADDVLKILSETVYSRSMTEVKRAQDFEKLLKKELENTYKDAYSLTNDKNIVDSLALKNDYLNLKILIKAKYLNQDKNEFLSSMGTVKAEDLRVGFENGNLNEYLQRAKNVAEEDFEKNHDPQRIDLIVDGIYFENLKEIAEKTETDMIKEYVSYQIDSYNILAFLRAKKQGVDLRNLDDIIYKGGSIEKKEILSMYSDSMDNIFNKLRKYKIFGALRKSEDSFRNLRNISEIEKNLKDGLLQIIKDAKKVVFGPEPIFGYVAAKEIENRLLRIILVSKLNNIPAEKIRERLSGLYV